MVLDQESQPNCALRPTDVHVFSVRIVWATVPQGKMTGALSMIHSVHWATDEGGLTNHSVARSLDECTQLMGGRAIMQGKMDWRNISRSGRHWAIHLPFVPPQFWRRIWKPASRHSGRAPEADG